MKIAIIVALDAEFNLTRNILENPTEGTLYITGQMGGHNIILMQSGIGKVNAASRLTTLIHVEHPDMVINSGVAGGIAVGMRQGDIVAATECAYHDVWCGSGERGQVQGLPLLFAADKRLLKATEGLNIKRGLIATGDQFIDNIETVEKIRKMYPSALACDMESTAFAQVCYLHNTPFMAFRIVSDTPGMEHDNLNQYNNFFDEAPQHTFALLKQIISNL